MKKLNFSQKLLCSLSLFLLNIPAFAQVPSKVLLKVELSDENLSGISEVFGSRTVSLASNRDGKSLLSYSSEDDSSDPTIRIIKSGKKSFLVKKGVLNRNATVSNLESINAMRFNSSGSSAAIISNIKTNSSDQEACLRKSSYSERVLLNCAFIFEPSVNQIATELTPESLLPSGTEFSLFKFEDIRYSQDGNYLYLVAFYKQIISINPLNTPFVRSIFRYNIQTKQAEVLFSSLSNSNIIASGDRETLFFIDFITASNNFILAAVDQGQERKIIKINLTSGEFSTLTSDSNDSYTFQGLWISEDGSNAKIHKLGRAGTSQAGKGKIISWSLGNGEKVLKCKTNSKRYSGNFAYPAISSDGKVIVFEDTDKLIAKTGSPASEIAVFDTEKRVCKRLGKTTRTFNSNNPVISQDAKLTSYIGFLDQNSRGSTQFVTTSKISDILKSGK